MSIHVVRSTGWLTADPNPKCLQPEKRGAAGPESLCVWASVSLSLQWGRGLRRVDHPSCSGLGKRRGPGVERARPGRPRACVAAARTSAGGGAAPRRGGAGARAGPRRRQRNRADGRAAVAPPTRVGRSAPAVRPPLRALLFPPAAELAPRR